MRRGADSPVNDATTRRPRDSRLRGNDGRGAGIWTWSAPLDGGADHARMCVFLRRHSRVGGNDVMGVRAALGRLARGAGAEDDGACGEQEAAGEGKHQ